MVGPQQRKAFLMVGAASFALGAVLLVLGKVYNEFALLVVGPCFMLTGVTWTVVILLAFKYAHIPQVETVPELELRVRHGGRVRLTESGFVDPVRCFCQIPEAEMRRWARKRYVDHVPTMTLLQSTDDPHVKEIISIVSMLDVDDATLLGVMSGVDMPDVHLLGCREKTRRILGLE